MLGSTVDTSLRQTTEAGFTGYDAPRAVFPSLSSGPRCLSSRPVWTRRTVLCEVSGGFAMSCGGESFSWLCLRLCMGQRYAGEGKIHHQLHPVPRGRWVRLHAQ